jgi:hypothetical protein
MMSSPMPCHAFLSPFQKVCMLLYLEDKNDGSEFLQFIKFLQANLMMYVLVYFLLQSELKFDKDKTKVTNNLEWRPERVHRHIFDSQMRFLSLVVQFSTGRVWHRPPE